MKHNLKYFVSFFGTNTRANILFLSKSNNQELLDEYFSFLSNAYILPKELCNPNEFAVVFAATVLNVTFRIKIGKEIFTFSTVRNIDKIKNKKKLNAYKISQTSKTCKITKILFFKDQSSKFLSLILIWTCCMMSKRTGIRIVLLLFYAYILFLMLKR